MRTPQEEGGWGFGVLRLTSNVLNSTFEYPLMELNSNFDFEFIFERLDEHSERHGDAEHTRRELV